MLGCESFTATLIDGLRRHKAEMFSGHESLGPQPHDALPKQSCEPIVAQAVKAMADQVKGRSLMAAIEAVQANWHSDGRPHRFDVK